jgi:hypothetical protein
MSSLNKHERATLQCRSFALELAEAREENKKQAKQILKISLERLCVMCYCNQNIPSARGIPHRLDLQIAEVARVNREARASVSMTSQLIISRDEKIAALEAELAALKVEKERVTITASAIFALQAREVWSLRNTVASAAYTHNLNAAAYRVLHSDYTRLVGLLQSYFQLKQ